MGFGEGERGVGERERRLGERARGLGERERRRRTESGEGGAFGDGF